MKAKETEDFEKAMKNFLFKSAWVVSILLAGYCSKGLKDWSSSEKDIKKNVTDLRDELQQKNVKTHEVLKRFQQDCIRLEERVQGFEGAQQGDRVLLGQRVQQFESVMKAVAAVWAGVRYCLWTTVFAASLAWSYNVMEVRWFL